MTRILFQAGLTFEAQISSRFLNKGFTLLDQICIGISRHDVTPLRALQLSGLGFSLPRRFPTSDLRIGPLVNKFVWSCLSKRKSSSTASNPLWIHPTGFCGSTIEFTETMIERVPQHVHNTGPHHGTFVSCTCNTQPLPFSRHFSALCGSHDQARQCRVKRAVINS